MKKAGCLIYVLFSIFLFSAVLVDASRGLKIKRIEDLSHQSGKLGEYKALIIGINDYIDPSIPDLETAVYDARSIGSILKERYGFKVNFLLDREATKKSIYQSLRKFAASSKPTDSILIYFAGHGYLDKIYDDGWWIPSDAKSGDSLTYLENNQVQRAMRSMDARHVLLISDSCYSGTLFGKARAMPPMIDDKYYLSLYNEKSRWGITSGNKTPVSDQGTEGHSVFAYQLLKELRNNRKPYISAQEIYTSIAPIVSNNSEQSPLCRPIRNTGDQGGEFVFVASLSKSAVEDMSKKENQETKLSLSPPKQVATNQENLFWESIKDRNKPDYFKAYLQRYPNGAFATLARLKLDELEVETDKDERKIIKSRISPRQKTGRLYIKTRPVTATVGILNVKQKFHQGIGLEPGRYQLEISAEGHKTKRMWVSLGIQENKNLTVELLPIESSYQKPTQLSQDRIERWINFLKEDNWDVRKSALKKLSKVKDERAFNALLDAVSTSGNKEVKEEYYFRIIAAKSLGKIGDERAIPILVIVMKKATYSRSIGRYAAFYQRDYKVNDAAADALVSIGRASIPPLIEIIESFDDEHIRSKAAESLGNLGGKEAKNALIGALKDKKDTVRVEVVKALGKISDEQSISALTEYLVKLTDKKSSYYTARILGNIGNIRAVPALEEALYSENSEVRVASAEALVKINKKKFMPILLNALKEEEEEDSRRAAAYALVQLGDERSVPALIDSLKDKGTYVRTNAANALGKIGDKRAVPALIEALKDEKPPVRSSAAKALGELGDQRAITPLEEASNDTENYVRESIKKALMDLKKYRGK